MTGSFSPGSVRCVALIGAGNLEVISASFESLNPVQYRFRALRLKLLFGPSYTRISGHVPGIVVQRKAAARRKVFGRPPPLARTGPFRSRVRALNLRPVRYSLLALEGGLLQRAVRLP